MGRTEKPTIKNVYHRGIKRRAVVGSERIKRSGEFVVRQLCVVFFRVLLAELRKELFLLQRIISGKHSCSTFNIYLHVVLNSSKLIRVRISYLSPLFLCGLFEPVI